MAGEITYNSYRIDAPYDTGFRSIGSYGNYLLKTGDKGIGDYYWVGDFYLSDASDLNYTKIWKDTAPSQEGIMRMQSNTGQAVIDGVTILSIDAPYSRPNQEATMALVTDDQIADYYNMTYPGDTAFGIRFINGTNAADKWRDFHFSKQAGYGGTITNFVSVLFPEGRIGIGIDEPTYKLHVIDTENAGAIRGDTNKTTGTNYGIVGEAVGSGADNNIAGYFASTGGTNNYALYLPVGYPAVGATNWSIYSASVAQSYFGGNVGIGISAPGCRLDVYNNISATYARIRGASDGDNYSGFELWSTDSTPRKWQFVHKENYDFNITHYNGSGWVSPFTITTGGNVGISVSDPDAKLEINGQIKITGGSPGAGKLLQSDANGLASWETITAGAISNSSTSSNDNYQGFLVGGGYSGTLYVTAPTTGNYLIFYGCGMLECSGSSGFTSYYMFKIVVNSTSEAESETYIMSTDSVYSPGVSMVYPKALTANDVVYLMIDRDHAAGTENTGIYGIYLTILRVS